MGQVAFAVGTGRCGTNFLYKVLSYEKFVKSTHERHALSDSYQRYVQFYGLPVDDAGFLQIKEEGIQDDLRNYELSFESSAFLSLNIESLHKRFNAKFIFLVRSPDKVINSYIQKGWYGTPLHRDQEDLPHSFQPNMRLPHHSFSRLVPRTIDGVANWNGLSQVGKLAWYWNEMNCRILEQLRRLPEEAYQIVKIEELDYLKYMDLCGFLGFQSALSQSKFKSLSESRPNRLYPTRTAQDWNEIERSEFTRFTERLCSQFGYEMNWSRKNGNELKKSRRSLRMAGHQLAVDVKGITRRILIFLKRKF